ncbi:class I SAM-dependent methyltransferase [Methanimicrococcus blatticola]|uniref:tRNA(Phe) (4-demethylwyosine(37)-C(7)) aminocarboxypropyltransferase n=1 Tax=Methanimicrococcus blatticola TaxID=91560 RepID=A0A484F375_9EURY|nr:class I SAM-dependent methyltransferase family protein [Methanimicrococcus blatticola]MCC2509462.1 class I SAM-dependent methyltransferase family protein [Methanimicrococcus blatticola]TDQ68340.1 methyltransferase [Methanimicrococcus blatticola]
MVKPQKLREFAAYYLSEFPDEAESAGISLTNDEINRLPANKQKIGDILVVSIPDSLSHKKQEIGKLLLLMDEKARLVLNDGGISGQFRIPSREIICCRSGESDSTETIHKENGCKFKLDVARIMFSKGNLAEKRILTNECMGEVIVDMFAGIGYFSIPIGVHSNPSNPPKIIAIELNPISYRYLCENIRLNGLEEVIEPICGDCQTLTPENIADRVLMGYVGTTHEFLETGIKAIKKEGGLLHYHETVHEKDFPERPVQRITEAAEKCGRNAVILESRKIKKYSPGVYHVVIDVEIQ